MSKSGGRFVARLYCDKRGVGAIKGAIKHGALKGIQSTGGTMLWSIVGSFASRKTLHVRLNVSALCDGTRVRLTLTTG